MLLLEEALAEPASARLSPSLLQLLLLLTLLLLGLLLEVGRKLAEVIRVEHGPAQTRAVSARGALGKRRAIRSEARPAGDNGTTVCRPFN